MKGSNFFFILFMVMAGCGIYAMIVQANDSLIAMCIGAAALTHSLHVKYKISEESIDTHEKRQTE